jgi:hypothetical protein
MKARFSDVHSGIENQICTGNNGGSCITGAKALDSLMQGYQ